jgi:membrane-associated phospholipid phosphatase
MALLSHFWRDTLFLCSHLLISMVAFTLILSFIVFAIRRPLRKYKPLDLAVFKSIDRITGTTMTRWMLAFTFIGKHQFLIPANLLLLLYFLFIRYHSGFSVRVAAIALSSLVLMLLLKKLFRRKRPLTPLLKSVGGLSFPSGHAIMSVAFFGMIIYIMGMTMPHNIYFFLSCGILSAVIFLIGFSRVYLRVHYASDVLAGFIIGIIWLTVSLTVVQKVEEAISLR